MSETIRVLREKRDAKIEEIDKLLKFAVEEGRGLSDEEKEKHLSLNKEIDSLEDLIKDVEKSEKRKAEFSRSSVDVKVTREDKCDEQGNYRGYGEFSKGGMGQFLADVATFAKSGSMPTKLKELRLAQGASEGVGQDGGFLPPADFVNELESSAIKAGKIASQCRTVQTSKPYVTINLLDETSRATGSRYGGVQAYRRKEAASVTASKPKYRQVNQKVEAIEAVYYATDELEMDAPFLQSFVAPAFAEEIAWKLDDEIIRGDGNGACLGILNAPTTISIAKESSQTADTLVYENIDKMLDRMLVNSRQRAQFYSHADCWQQLRNMVKSGSNSDFLMFSPLGGFGAQQFEQMVGRPINTVEQASALGDKGDFIFADFGRYLLIRRSGVTQKESSHVAFLTSEMVYKWTSRIIGQPIDNAPLTDAYGTNTRSAFIVVADRA